MRPVQEPECREGSCRDPSLEETQVRIWRKEVSDKAKFLIIPHFLVHDRNSYIVSHARIYHVHYLFTEITNNWLLS